MTTLKNYTDKLAIWENWQSSYASFVPKFIAEASTGKSWDNWETNVFKEFFEVSTNQCVSSLQLGYFSTEEKIKIKENWDKISPLLKKIALEQEIPQFDTYKEVKNIIRQYTTQNKKAATNRLIASLQPKLMCTIVNEERLKTLIKLLNKNILNCNIPITEDWFKNSYAVWKYYLENLGETEPYNHITLPWQTYATLLNKTNKTNEMEDSQHKKLLEYKKQIILQGPPGTGKTRRAKEIALEMLGLNDTEELKNNEQFKLIQFHPSYTYEDFVRGIVSKPNEDGDGIIYEAEDKVLADFAKKALDNYIESNKTNVIVNEDTSIFNAFIENIKDELAQNEHHKYDITEAVYLFSADETRFKYKGDNWIAHSKGLNMKFSELKKIIDLGATERQDIKKMTDAEELTRQHATYFMKVVEKYYEFEQSYQPETIQTEEVLLKNYILVIDEINRANLSSVLGELIYALEYRGKAVESIYTLDGATNERKNKLILPPNLYIIGTMNTADRSVGHIDYAIRRRFAFVDVLPKKLENDVNLIFRDDIFRMVSELFIKNYDEYSNDKNVNLIPADTLFSDFKPQDVWLGHSYFIQKKDKNKEGEEFLTPEEFSIRIQYEIIPILEEYIKDGILNELAREVIKKLKTITEGA